MKFLSLPVEVWVKTLVAIGAAEVVLFLLLLWMVRASARATQAQSRGLVVAFYHPRCTGGGGGERVLWKMIQVLSEYAIVVGSETTATTTTHSNKISNDANSPPVTVPTPTEQSPTSSTSPPPPPTIEQIIIYTTEKPTATYAQDAFQHVKERFAIELPYQTLNLRFVHLDEYSDLLEPSRYLSLLLESWGTLRLAFTALQMTLQSGGLLTVPHVWIDTTGAAFTYLPARILFGCQIVAYVHYPTISTDMLRRVWQTRTRSTTAGTVRMSADDDNDITISPTSGTTTTRSVVKCVYYILFAVLYGAVGSLASLVLTNSTWTYNHIQSLWKYAAWRNRIRIVYPPCRFPSVQHDNDSTTATEDDAPQEPNNHNSVTTTSPPPPSGKRKTNAIVSIGQFRPEKDHVLQLQVMARLLKQHPEWKHKTPKCQLILIGSCRDNNDTNNDTNSDRARLDKLQALAKTMGIEEFVEFVVNQPIEVVQKWLLEGSVGLHTMWNEHFGIAIVESMAAGQIMVAHKSGGPQSDIVVPCQGDKTTGFLATTADEYAERIHEILSMSDSEAYEIRRNAQQSAQRFSDQVFEEAFRQALVDLKLIDAAALSPISYQQTGEKQRRP